MSGVVKKYLVVLGLLYTGTTAAGQDLPTIGYCSNCSSAGFAWAAEQAAPSTGGMHPVYVIDTTFGEVRYFNVSVWWDCGGNERQSVEDGVQSLDDDGMGSSTLSNCTQKEAIQGVGDEFIISQMLIAHDGVSEFVSPKNFQFDSGDLPNTGDTALDLIGPIEGPAGQARESLQIAVGNHLQSLHNRGILVLADTATRIANRFLGSSNYLSPASLITVTYPDGTSIKIAIVQISSFIDGSITVLVEVLMETGELPDGQAAPRFEERFDNFNFSGGEDIVQNLIDLANRFGIPITGAGGSGPTLRCVTVDGVRFCERI